MPRASQPLTHRNQNPEYAAAVAEIAKLQAALVPVRGRINEIAILINSPDSHEERHAGHVEAAMHFVETGMVRRSQNSETLAEDHLRLREQSESLEATIRDKQEALYRLESKLSHEALANVKADFDDIRDRYVAKLRELDAIGAEERELMNSLNALGYYPGLGRTVAWDLIGNLADPQSAISAQVRYLVHR